jgi:hypothetical protein
MPLRYWPSTVVCDRSCDRAHPDRSTRERPAADRLIQFVVGYSFQGLGYEPLYGRGNARLPPGKQVFGYVGIGGPRVAGHVHFVCNVNTVIANVDSLSRKAYCSMEWPLCAVAVGPRAQSASTFLTR